MIYFLAIILTLLLEYQSNKHPLEMSFLEAKEIGFLKSKNQFILPCIFRVFVFMPLFLIGALRYNVGTDYATYTSLQIPEVLSGNFSRVEFIYAPIIYFFSGILHSNQLFFALIHLIILVFTIKSINENSHNKYLSIVLLLLTGFFNMSLNIMRQAISTVLIMYGLKYIEKRNIKKFIYLVLIAFLFHKSAFIYFLLIPLAFCSFKIWMLPALSMILFILKDYIRMLVVHIVSFTSYAHYFKNKWWETNISSTTLILVNIIILLLFYFVIFHLYCDQNKVRLNKFKDRNNIYLFLNSKLTNIKLCFYLNLQVIITLLSLCSSIIPNAIRVIYLFFPFQILTIPYLINLVKNKRLKIVIIIFIILIYSTLFYKYFIVRNMGETFPYHSIISD